MKYLFAVIFMVTLVSCNEQLIISTSINKSLAANDLTSCGLIRNEKKEEIHWNQFPVKFYIEDSIPEEFHNSIREAAQEWNKTLGFNAIEVKSKLAYYPGISPNFNLIYWVQDANLLQPNQEAVTFMTWIGNVTASANILLNAPRFQFSVETVEYDKVDMTSLMIHEFGHALNLDHSDNAQSVMQPVLGFGQLRQHISDLDKASVLCGISHRHTEISGVRMASLSGSK